MTLIEVERLLQELGSLDPYETYDPFNVVDIPLEEGDTLWDLCVGAIRDPEDMNSTPA